MNQNAEVIEQIQSGSAAFLDSLSDRSTSELTIRDLEIDAKGITHNGIPVKENALKKIFGMLRVKNNFSDFATKMTEEDWKTVSGKLKTTEGDVKMYGSIIKDSQGNQQIIDVLPHKDGKKNEDDASYRQYFDWITTSLEESEKEYSLKSLGFDNKGNAELILLNQSESIDVFGNDTDLWKTGDRFAFNGLQFNYAPFFERLVCTNGNTANQFGFGANISKNTFNNKKIQSVIEKSIKFHSETMPATLEQAVNHLKSNNISIKEFYQFREFFSSRNVDGVYDRLLLDYFDDKPFYKGYGMDIASKSRKWKSTANSGINAYDYFNGLTYIASHPNEIKLIENHRAELQIHASDLLFKKELDLEDIASGVKIDYPKLIIMN